MAHPQAIPMLCQKEILLFRSPTYGLMVGAISGQRSQGLTRIVAAFLSPSVYSSPTRKMAVPRPFQSWVRWKYFCLGVPRMVSWWVQYLAKGSNHDFNNGPGTNSDSCHIFTSRRLYESDSNNGFSPGHSNLGSDGSTSVSVSHLWSPGRCNIWLRAPGSDFNNGPGTNSDSGRFLPSRRLCKSNSNNGPSPVHSNLGTLKKITIACTTVALLIL